MMDTLFGARLRQHAANARAPLALAMPGLAITYRDLYDRVGACAGWLRREGCRPSGTVGITVGDEIAHLVVSLALLRLGIPQVCLPTHDPAPMRSRIARRLAVERVLIADPRLGLDTCATSLLTPDVFASRDGGIVADDVVTDPDVTALYSASSGTTGEPKIIALSQRLLARRADRFGPAQGFAPDERVLIPASVESYAGKTTRLYAAYLGVTSILQPRTLAPAAIPALCADLHVTCLELNVLHALDLAEGDAPRAALPAFTRVFAGGSRVPVRLRREFRAASGAPLYVNYGAQEVWRVASTFPDGDDDTAESVGKPFEWVDLDIVDADGTPLPAGAIGEIRVRSDVMVHAYHDDPLATSRHFRDGWFYPGDMGSRARDGSLQLHGRKDDMMNLNSIKIFPAEIEGVLEQHPSVRNAAAFAVASATLGDIPVAAVETRENAPATGTELLAHARRLLGARAPRRIYVVDALPRNAAGKVVKRDLPALVNALSPRG